MREKKKMAPIYSVGKLSSQVRQHTEYFFSVLFWLGTINYNYITPWLRER